LIGIVRVPIVLFSSGTLNIINDKITYEASQYKVPGSKFCNLSNSLKFSLTPEEVVRIERYQHPEAIIKYYNINWIRVITNNEILKGDFLLTVGGKGPSMKKLRNQTNQLYQALIQFKKHMKFVNSTE
jgi:hypothetical protein